MLGVAHLTSEGREAIGASHRVFWIGSVPGLAELLADLRIVGEDLSRFYVDGAADVENYARIKARILESLAQEHDCTLVVPGHPRVGVTVVQELQVLAATDNVRLLCYPGISSFDVMLNDVGLDPLEEGSCVVDANRLILYDYAMEPSLNYFIYHVCSVGNSRTDYVAPATTSRSDFLAAKLRKHYPDAQPLSLLSASMKPGGLPDRIEGTLGNLTGLLRSVTYGHTLFVPATVPKREQVNWGFLERIRAGSPA